MSSATIVTTTAKMVIKTKAVEAAAAPAAALEHLCLNEIFFDRQSLFSRHQALFRIITTASHVQSTKNVSNERTIHKKSRAGRMHGEGHYIWSDGSEYTGDCLTRVGRSVILFSVRGPFDSSTGDSIRRRRRLEQLIGSRGF